MGRYFINTYGCQMNVHESEKLAGILQNMGLEEADSVEYADVVVFNTCAIRETAESRVLGNLGKIKKLKEKKPSLRVVVCGCMSQRPGAAEMLYKRCPFVDVIIGTHNLGKLPEYLALNERVVDIWEESRDNVEAVSLRKPAFTHAYVNIMYGCDNFCSYCIVPYVRGRERSRGYREILGEVEKLLRGGYKEIVLLGQNVNSYRSEEYDFPRLLDAVCNLGGKYRVSFMTSHPKDLSLDLVEAVAENSNAAKYIHLPVQAGSDRILSLMNRKYSRHDYLQKISLIRKLIPAVGLSSDFMVGFPTETEADFEDTLSLIREVRFDNLFTFIYSRRSGTVADKMEGQVPYEIKKDRIERLIKEQFAIANQIAAQDIGRRFEVLVEESKGGVSRGKTACGRSLTINDSGDLRNRFVTAEVVARRNNRLFARLIGE